MELFSSLDIDNPEDKLGMKLQQPRNNAPSNLQITAEQIIKESQAHRTDELQIPIQRINDESELADYKLKRRKEFEDQLRRNRYNISTYVKYAYWEERQDEFIRARSIFERAIAQNYKNVSLWLKYAEMEMKNGFISYARNIWERAVKLLPMEDQLWFKWAYMEEMLENYTNAREVFKGWVSWTNEEKPWKSFIKFEERMGQIDRAREVIDQYIDKNKNLNSILMAVKLETKYKNTDKIKSLYEKGFNEFLPDEEDEKIIEKFLISYIKFLTHEKKYDKCRELFDYGLNELKIKSEDFHNFKVNFEKMHGNKGKLEDIIISRRRLFYLNKLEQNPFNYDCWFSYTKLEENYGNANSVREIYEKAISNIPPLEEKKYWRRYIFLWINYAIYEELIMKDLKRSEEIYQKLIEIIPHSKFTFSKVWILYAHFFLRRKDLQKARKIFGLNLAFNPKEKVLDAYVDLEIQLGEVDRVRKIYQSFLTKLPEKSSVWIKFAFFEKSLDEKERCEAIFESAIGLTLDFPEKVWKEYIQIEIEFENFEKAEKIYENLLKKTKHVKVWYSFAKFLKERNNISKMRKLFEKGIDYFKEKKMEEELKFLIDRYIDEEDDDAEKDLIKKKYIKAANNDTNDDLLGDIGNNTTAVEDNTFDFGGMEFLENAISWKKDKEK